MLRFFIICIVVGGIVALSVMRRRVGVRKVLRYAGGQGWEMMIVDSFSRSDGDSSVACYRIRYRDRDGALIEAVLEDVGFNDFRLGKQQRIPKEVERGMFDQRIAMDCRKCGAIIPIGSRQCPYCRGSRDELRIS